MKPLAETSKSNPHLLAALGALKTLIAMILLWIGLNSLFIGWAYFHEKAYWVPLLVGAGLIFGAISLLVKGVGQMGAVSGQNTGRR